VSLVDDISGDWQYIEGIESVDILPAEGEGALVRGVKSLRRAMGGNPLVNATAGIDPSDVTFHLWTVTLQGVKVANGFIIQAADQTEWTVLSVGESIRTGRLICNCRQRV